MAPPRESRWRKRVKFGAGPLVILALAGVTYQSVSNALERRAFPHPGRQVDVGGHQLHLHCTGEGMHTVVFEAPAAAVSVAWAPVQLRVSEFARACSYDRAGLGWSESDGSRFNPADVPRQLHALLTTGQIAGPYVMVGQGLGAALARQYARQFPGEVAALVVIDAPGSSVQPRSSAMPGIVTPEAWPWLARFGILRLTGVLTSMASGLPEPQRGAVRAFLNRPDHLSRSAEELSRWDESVRLGGVDDDLAIRVFAVQAQGPKHVGLLTHGDAVERTVAAIRRAVATTASTRP
jgi:pimeloyl-ACP methyl ester carboxylesterase